MAHDVFVSYSSKDKIAADMVVAALERQQVRCWVAPRDLLVGQEWAEGILRAIEISKLMVLVFSDHTNNSTHVRKEVERAVHHGLAVAPIRLTTALPEDALEYFLSSSHWLDAMTPPLEQHLSELTRKVKLLLGVDTAPLPGDSVIAGSLPPAVAPNRRPSQIGLIAALSILFVAGIVWASIQFGRSSATRTGQPATNTAGGKTTPVSGTATGTVTGTGDSGVTAKVLTGTEGIPKSTNLPETIDVSTPEALIAAIGPDRTIRVAPGEYLLTDVPETKMEFIRWDQNVDGNTITIRNVKNLAIVGQGNQPVRLIVRPRYVFVLHFEKCQQVQLTNLVLGHSPERGKCSSGVVGATDCTGIKISKCDLFGCGTEGLTLHNVNQFKFSDSVIRDCSSAIMTLIECSHVEFTRSRFVGNSEFWGVKIFDSKDVIFNDCDMEKNTFETGALFEIKSSAGVVFDGGKIENNVAAALTEEANTVTFHNTSIDGNKFSRQ